jgi:hypothetical protein
LVTVKKLCCYTIEALPRSNAGGPERGLRLAPGVPL